MPSGYECNDFSVNLVIIVLILIVNTIFSFSNRLSRIGKPCFDFQTPCPASGQPFSFFIGTFPRRGGRFHFSLTFSHMGQPFLFFIVTYPRWDSDFQSQIYYFSFILYDFDEKSAQINHILYDFCSMDIENHRNLCNFAAVHTARQQISYEMKKEHKRILERNNK